MERLTLDDGSGQAGRSRQRTAVLRYDADLKAREIAAVLEMDTHAVEVALSRALERLRRLLGERLTAKSACEETGVPPVYRGEGIPRPKDSHADAMAT